MVVAILLKMIFHVFSFSFFNTMEWRCTLSDFRWQPFFADSLFRRLKIGICCEKSLYRTNILMELISNRNFKMKHFLGLLKIRGKFGKAVPPITTVSLLICRTLLPKIVFTQQR